MGGDEFVVILLPDSVYPELERIVRNSDDPYSKKPWFLEGRRLLLHHKYGDRIFPGGWMQTVEELVRKMADIALYVGQERGGKNRVESLMMRIVLTACFLIPQTGSGEKYA